MGYDVFFQILPQAEDCSFGSRIGRPNVGTATVRARGASCSPGQRCGEVCWKLQQTGGSSCTGFHSPGGWKLGVDTLLSSGASLPGPQTALFSGDPLRGLTLPCCLCPSTLLSRGHQWHWTRPTLVTSFYLNYCFKDPVSKHSHIPKSLG